MSELYNLYNIGEDVNDSLIELLRDLHAFGKLDERVISIISAVFRVDVSELCEDNGITYDID